MAVLKALSQKMERSQEGHPVCEAELVQVKKWICEAEAIVIGAGSGLSTAAGLTYSGERFEKYFREFIGKYGFTDMYSAGFYPFRFQEEKWAYWSRHIYYNRYDQPESSLYRDLLELVKGRDYFVITTNVDHQFLLNGFDRKRVFATQGDYGLFQCAVGCHKKLYGNEAVVREMIAKQKDCRIPASLVPVCPICGGRMEVNLRCDEYFVEDGDWEQSSLSYELFVNKHRRNRILFLEMGVGMNTPGIIKYPFWQMTRQWENARYVCINKGQAWAPEEIEDRTVCVNQDIVEVMREIRGTKR